MYALGPIQLWMPMFSVNSKGANVEEFCNRSDWDGVQTIWMMPKEMVNLAGEVWWFDGYRQQKNLAVPADSFDRIDVIHVGFNGFAGQRNYFPTLQVEQDRLSQQWRCCTMDISP